MHSKETSSFLTSGGGRTRPDGGAAATKRLVLIVDDNPEKTLALQSVVEELELGIVVAPSAEQALRELLKHEFALALLDVHMPQMDGFELAALIRSRAAHENLPIVFMSSIDPTEERLELAYKLGAIDFIPLPARRPLIKAKLASMLGLNAKTPRFEQLVRAAPPPTIDERFRLLLERAEDVGIFFLDSSGRVVEWSRAAERCTGWSATEIVGRDFSLFFVPGDVALGVPREILAASGGTDGGVTDRWMVRKDGTRFVARFCVVALGGTPDRGFGVLLRDVSGQRQAEQERQIKVQVLEVMGESVCVVNEELRIVFANPATVATFGYALPELIGSDVRLLNAYPPDEHETRVAELLAHLERHGQWVGEWQNRRKDGSVFLTHTRVSRFQQDGIIYFVCVQEDLTRRKEAEAALQRSVQLQEIVGELEAFSYSVSHDLKSPLRTLRGFADAVIQDYGDALEETGLDYMRRIRRAAERLEKMVEDILSVSRLSRESLPLGPVALRPLLAGILEDSVQLRLPAAEIKIVGDMPVVMGHEPSLRQVFVNLLGNAVKFVPRERQPQVTIRTETSRGHVTIWIEDNGIGMEARDQEKIFRAFERLESAAPFPGTGVGLAIVKRIVERLGGSVGVESAPNQGSRFWVRLRLAA